MGDEAGLRDLFERSGMVRVVDAVPDVLVWQLPHDAEGLPADMLAALADPAAPGVVALADRHPIRWFQEALRLGVDDVLCLPQTPQSLGMAAAKARAAAGTAGSRRRGSPPHRRPRLHRLLDEGRLRPHGDRDQPGGVLRPERRAHPPHRPRPALRRRRARARPRTPHDRPRPGHSACADRRRPALAARRHPPRQRRRRPGRAGAPRGGGADRSRPPGGAARGRPGRLRGGRDRRRRELLRGDAARARPHRHA